MAARPPAQIRNYRKQDKTALLELFAACWDEEKSEMNLACWEWLYEMNPNTDPERPVIFILEEAGRIIGSVSCVPAQLMVEGVIYNFHWVMDYMVHPRHRGGMKGFRLAREVIKLSASTLGSGFPIQETVPIWLRAGKKVGVDEVGAFGPMVLPLNARYLLQRKSLNPLLTWTANLALKPTLALQRMFRGLGTPRDAGLTITGVERFDRDASDFFARVGPGYPIIVVRDDSYLNWRFSDYPGKHYTKLVARDASGSMRGYLVLRTVLKRNGVREGLVVDFLAERGDEAAIRALVQEGLAIFRRERCDVAKGLEFFVPDMREIMVRLGFFHHPVKRHYLIFYNELCPDKPKSFFRDKANWYITRNFADQEINEYLD
jgi:hypothetical protein